jgi:hypothetical protein
MLKCPRLFDRFDEESLTPANQMDLGSRVDQNLGDLFGFVIVT